MLRYACHETFQLSCCICCRASYLHQVASNSRARGAQLYQSITMHKDTCSAVHLLPLQVTTILLEQLQHNIICLYPGHIALYMCCMLHVRGLIIDQVIAVLMPHLTASACDRVGLTSFQISCSLGCYYPLQGLTLPSSII